MREIHPPRTLINTSGNRELELRIKSHSEGARDSLNVIPLDEPEVQRQRQWGRKGGTMDATCVKFSYCTRSDHRNKLQKHRRALNEGETFGRVDAWVEEAKILSDARENRRGTEIGKQQWVQPEVWGSVLKKRRQCGHIGFKGYGRAEGLTGTVFVDLQKDTWKVIFIGISVHA